MDNLVIFLVLLGLGYFVGHMTERRHYKSIVARETAFLGVPAVTSGKRFEPERTVARVELVTGSVVVSIDYFKRILAALRNIFGGEVGAYESLVDRARREAMLRMREAAGSADIVVNCRIETAAIGQSANRKNSVGSVEAIAYGTAIEYVKT
jgi:uncharacterized protein YbjQ (UPF0145 family)